MAYSLKCKTTVFEIHTRVMHTTPRMVLGVDPTEETTHFVKESETEPIDSGALARDARLRSTMGKKCGKLPIRENLVIT